MEVLQVLAKEGLYSVSMTRTGVDPFRVVKLPAATKAYITHYDQAVNVVNIDSLQQAMDAAQPSAVIFCASASKQGGSAFQVDGDGVGNAALVAKKLGARLIVVSAMAVDRPESKSYQVTNTLGGNLNGIMDAKRQGEQKVRSTLNDYVIVRPGVLMGGKSTQGGVAAVQVNQGDTIGGGLSRDELAGVVVGALQSGTKGATVEVYRKSTATKLQPEFSVPSGLESSSDTYKGLFASVTADN
jgi:dTDP-4-dehydrorhamnose reductase